MLHNVSTSNSLAKADDYRDLGWKELMNSPEIVQYYSECARNFPEHGFHNEILTSAVRLGIWGLVSSIALFFISHYLGCKNIAEIFER